MDHQRLRAGQARIRRRKLPLSQPQRRTAVSLVGSLSPGAVSSHVYVQARKVFKVFFFSLKLF
jgi:hypothetical protein